MVKPVVLFLILLDVLLNVTAVVFKTRHVQDRQFFSLPVGPARFSQAAPVSRALWTLLLCWGSCLAHLLSKAEVSYPTLDQPGYVLTAILPGSCSAKH